MPSFQDSIFIFVLALLLFGPKKLPELARYLGKLMNEFRRASSEFRLQMDDEFRSIEQAEQQKKIAAIEAAAPVAPLLSAEAEPIPDPVHPHEPPPVAADIPASEPIPIASNGDLHLMPPATGLPVPRASGSSATPSGSVTSLFDTIPHIPDPVAVTVPAEPEAQNHG